PPTGAYALMRDIATIVPAAAYYHRWVWIRSAKQPGNGAMAQHASMRAGDTHRTAAHVSRGLHAGDDAGLWSIAYGDTARESAAGEREGRRCTDTGGSGCSA